MTLDGYCDHTAVTPGADIHQHYTDLMRDAGILLYGRKTFELMKFWQEVLENPLEEPAMNDFAKAIDQTPKLVFSTTMETTGWASATMANSSLATTIQALKNSPGKPITIGSKSLIIQCLQQGLLDEFQLCIHPVVAGGGTALFSPNLATTTFQLSHTKTFESGEIVLYYNV